ncbi:MAG: WYL domain-containing protein [Bacillota bacterium]|nr:WYL domain-containing protein [Bacillota bacterium]
MASRFDEAALGRMIRLLHALRAAPQGLTEAELAAVCGVAPATVREDLRLLCEYANVPLYNEADGEGSGEEDDLAERNTAERPWHLQASDYLLPPLPLTAVETWALLEALQPAWAESGTEADSALRAVRERLKEALLGNPQLRSGRRGQGGADGEGEIPQPGRPIVVKGVRPVYDPGQPEALVRRLERAIRARQRLLIRYRSAGTGEVAERRVDPYGLLYYWVQAAWYLVGHCHRARGIRTFRLDRLQRVQELTERFSYPSGFCLDEYFRYSWGVEHGKLHRVVIRFWDQFNVLARVRKETAHRRDASLTLEPGGTLLFTDMVSGLNEIRVWVRSFGESAAVLEPRALRESVRESALLILERYGEVVPRKLIPMTRRQGRFR